ncbi:MAG: hypothetical protein JWM27_2880 [Gemmatimonadetes bacterium]|nr:hypothetical protein [Gemmatimonadota bacterium]
MDWDRALRRLGGITKPAARGGWVPAERSCTGAECISPACRSYRRKRLTTPGAERNTFHDRQGRRHLRGCLRGQPQATCLSRHSARKHTNFTRPAIRTRRHGSAGVPAMATAYRSPHPPDPRERRSPTAVGDRGTPAEPRRRGPEREHLYPPGNAVGGLTGRHTLQLQTATSVATTTAPPPRTVVTPPDSGSRRGIGSSECSTTHYRERSRQDRSFDRWTARSTAGGGFGDRPRSGIGRCQERRRRGGGGATDTRPGRRSSPGQRALTT